MAAPRPGLVGPADEGVTGRADVGEDIRRSELKCPVSTAPVRIADFLRHAGDTGAGFATYHSLRR